MRTSSYIALIIGFIYAVNCQSSEYYLSYPLKKNWYQASQHCLSNDQLLVDLSSVEEEEKILSLIKASAEQNGGDHHNYWTSGTDLGSEGSFYWFSTAKPLTISQWAIQPYPQPDNWRQGVDNSYWTSGTDLGTEGSFYWFTTGQPVIYSNWSARPRQPDNWMSKENCLEYAEPYNFTWNDVDCLAERLFICRDSVEITTVGRKDCDVPGCGSLDVRFDPIFDIKNND